MCWCYAVQLILKICKSLCFIHEICLNNYNVIEKANYRHYSGNLFCLFWIFLCFLRVSSNMQIDYIVIFYIYIAFGTWRYLWSLWKDHHKIEPTLNFKVEDIHYLIPKALCCFVWCQDFTTNAYVHLECFIDITSVLRESEVILTVFALWYRDLERQTERHRYFVQPVYWY